MAILQIPTSPEPFYTQVTDLEGTDYLLTFRWNQREDAYYLTIALSDETPLVNGIKIVCSVDLLSRFADVRLPKGVLMAVPLGVDDSIPRLGELGIDARVVLMYAEVSSIVVTE